MLEPVFDRIVLKLSGEALMGSQDFGIDEPVVAQIALRPSRHVVFWIVWWVIKFHRCFGKKSRAA